MPEQPSSDTVISSAGLNDNVTVHLLLQANASLCQRLTTTNAIPIFIGLPLGERIGKTLSTQVFGRIILVLLTVLAVKMLADAAMSIL